MLNKNIGFPGNTKIRCNGKDLTFKALYNLWWTHHERDFLIYTLDKNGNVFQKNITSVVELPKVDSLAKVKIKQINEFLPEFEIRCGMNQVFVTNDLRKIQARNLQADIFIRDCFTENSDFSVKSVAVSKNSLHMYSISTGQDKAFMLSPGIFVESFLS